MTPHRITDTVHYTTILSAAVAVGICDRTGLKERVRRLTGLSQHLLFQICADVAVAIVDAADESNLDLGDDALRDEMVCKMTNYFHTAYPNSDGEWDDVRPAARDIAKQIAKSQQQQGD